MDTQGHAAWNAIMHPGTDKLAVLRTGIVTYTPQVALDVTAIVYGVLGGLLGHTLSAIPSAFTAAQPRPRRTA